MNVHREVLQSMKEMAEKFAGLGVELQLPPASAELMGTEYVDLEMGKSLCAKFFFNSKYANPLQTYQGGLLTAAFDEVFGPLTYMAAEGPVVTLEISTTFLRPFMLKDEWMIVKAEVVSQSKSVMFLEARATTKDGKLIATARNHSIILSASQLTRIVQKD